MDNKPPRHLAERIATELMPDSLAGLSRMKPQPAPRPKLVEPAAVTVPALAAPIPVAPMQDRSAVPLKAEGRVLTRTMMESAGMVVASGRRDQVAEEFRIVRQHVVKAIAANEAMPETERNPCANVIMVTSARHGEGKSFMALNLATILAEGAERPVLLIDADIGGGSLSTHFGMQDQEGFLDLAVSPRQLARAATIPAEIGNLGFIPVGGGDEARRTALSSRQPLRSLVERLGRQFSDSIVVLDMPPCLSSSDPTELAGLVGQIVLIVEAGQTRRKDIEGALDLVDACPNISLVLNRQTQRGRGSFGLSS